MRERRRYSRRHYEIRGFNLYRDGNWLAVPQSVIRAVFLGRAVRGGWVPDYPSRESVPIGADVASEIIQEERCRKMAL